MNNLVPKGWSYDQLGDYISESVTGEWGAEAVGDANDIPVLRSTNFTANGIIDYSKLAYRNIDERKRLAKSLKFGDIVLEKSGGSPTQPVGRVVYFDKYKPFLFSNFTQKLSPVDTCDSKFLFYKLYSEYQNGTVLKFQQQTTGIINFQLAEYLSYKSAFPPLPEQQKIATILTSVDTVIEKTRAQIDKLKHLKTGMMQQLLTQGIDHTEFKNTPVGRIPKTWGHARLEDVAVIQTGVAKNSKITGDLIEIPYLRVANVQDGYLDLTEIKTLQLDRTRLERFMLRDNDILVNEGGDFDKLGRGFIWKNQISPCVHQNHVFVVRTNQEKLLPMFFNYLSGSQYGKQYYLGCAKQTTNLASLNSSQLKQFPVLLPTLEEQADICEALNSIDMKVRNIEQKLRSITEIKKALMQDLLTGKVRV